MSIDALLLLSSLPLQAASSTASEAAGNTRIHLLEWLCMERVS
jgi:hypothetical protein